MIDTGGVAEPVEQQAGVAQGEGLEREQVTSPPTEKVPATVRCVFCGENMTRDELPRFNRGFGITILVIGLVLSLFMLLLLGLPLVVIGAYMVVSSRSVWACRECGAVVDRNGPR